MQRYGFVGEPANVGIDFYNTGKVTLYNLFVNVEELQTLGTDPVFRG